MFLEFPPHSRDPNLAHCLSGEFKLRHRHSHRRALRRIGQPRKIVLFVSGLLLGCIAWFAPCLLLNSPLREQLLGSVTQRLDGKLTVGWISAGWLSPTVARDVVWTDAQGGRLVEAISIGTDRSVGALLTNRYQLGRIRIERPRLTVDSRADGSNFDAALESLLEQQTQTDPAMTGVVEIVDGQIDVSDQTRDESWSVTAVNASFGPLDPAAAPLTAKVAAEVVTQHGNLGRLSADLTIQQASVSETPQGGSGSASLHITTVPLPLVGATLRRLLPDLKLEGTLNGEVTANWNPGQAALQLDEFTVQGLSVATPTFLGSDRLHSDSVSLNGGLSSSGSTWQVDALTLESDLVDVQLRGKGTLTSTNGLHSLQEAWERGSYELGGTVDMAKLAQTLPQTLRIREGTYVSSGRMTFALFAKPREGLQTWNGRLEASQLAGMHSGQPLVWDKPIEIVLKAQRAGDEIRIDDLTCRATFLEITAQGTSQQGSIAARGNLDRFAAEIERFVDLGELKLAGQLAADLRWQQDRDGHVSVEGTAKTTGFEFTTVAARPWREPSMEIKLSAEALAGANGLRSLNNAALDLDSQGDRFRAELLAPVQPLGLAQDWPVALQLAGKLQTWLPRLQAFVALPNVDLDGSIAVAAETVITRDHIEIRNGKLNADELQIETAAFSLREPAVEVLTSATWHAGRRELSSSTTTFASSSLAFRADDVRASFSEQATRASAKLGYRADLARLHALVDVVPQKSKQRISGEAIGSVGLAYESGVTSADWSAEISDFLLARRTPATGVTLAQSSSREPWRTVWAEPRVKLEGQVRYDHNRDRIELDQLQLAGEAISLGVEGNLQQLWTRCEAELQGQVAYDLQSLSLALQDQFGDSLQLVGRDSRPFSLQGPLFARTQPSTQQRVEEVSVGGAPQGTAASVLSEIIARASLAWTSANIRGFVIGPGELQTQLSNGHVQIAPLDLPVSEGRLRLEPSLDISGESPILSVPHGQLDQVRVNPQMCRTWLKFVAPLVADATAAEGLFSLAVTDARIPLDKPHAGALHGKLTVHSARIGPGPMTRELVWLVQQITALLSRRPLSPEYQDTSDWMALPEQEFTFQLADERVHHRDLQLNIHGVNIRTTGSVGMDQTLSLAATVPIQDEWLAADRRLASLRGKVVTVPIHGTLSQPRLDRGALKQLSAQLLTETATGAASQLLERGINQGLDKLFGPPRE